MSRWALISWPLKEKNPLNNYLIIGEIYDENIKKDKNILSQFCEDLNFLYPFKFSKEENKCYNSEDFIYFQNKYKLTVNLRLIGKIKRKIIIFRSPQLYDLKEMKPIFTKKCKPVYEEKNDTVCFIFPHPNPVIRGESLKTAVLFGAKFFVISGGKFGKNKDNLYTLMSRYLLSCKVPINKIIKIKEENNIEWILEAIEIIKLFFSEGEDYQMRIICFSELISEISKTVRTWRRNNIIQKKIYYFTN